MPTPHLSRRTLLRATVGAGLATTTLGGLAACGGGAETPAITASKVVLPTYVPFEGIQADLPPIPPTGVQGFLKYPSSLVDSVAGPVLVSGKPVRALAAISAAPYVAREANTILQSVEKRIGGQLDFISVTESDYLARFNTTVAGGDLPDVMYFQKVSNYGALLQAKFADLTPHLSGDAITKYPNLANLPSALWQACAVGDRIYGLPQPRNGMNGLGLYHQEMFESVGGQPKNADDLFAKLQELTRPAEQRWGAVSRQGSVYNLPTYLQIFGAPLNWSVTDGALTAAVETPQYRAAVEFAAKLYAAGIYHPNSNGPASQMSTVFNNGQAAFTYNSITGLPDAITKQAAVDQSFAPAAFTAFSHDGATPPIVYLDFVSKVFTAIAKADDARVQEILALANFLAAPLGSTEYELLRFGIEGQTFAYQNGFPTLTDTTTRMGQSWGMITAPPFTLFSSVLPEGTTAQYEATKALAPLVVTDPVGSLYSATDSRTGATLRQRIDDACTAIIAGRQPMSSYDSMVEDWKSKGGDTIRGEYEEALATAG